MTEQEYRTRFETGDSPTGKRHDNSEAFGQFYNRLAMHNNSKKSGKWHDENDATAEDHAYLIDSVGSSLSLTEYQRERAKHIEDQLPDTFFRAYRNVAVVLAICGLVGREDGRPYHPANVFSDGEVRGEVAKEMRSLCDEHNIVARQYRSIYERIRHASDL